MPLQWRNQIWQSLEEGAGERCSEHRFTGLPRWWCIGGELQPSWFRGLQGKNVGLCPQSPTLQAVHEGLPSRREERNGSRCLDVGRGGQRGEEADEDRCQEVGVQLIVSLVGWRETVLVE